MYSSGAGNRIDTSLQGAFISRSDEKVLLAESATIKSKLQFYFILGEAGGKAAMNSARTRCLINTFPVLRGQIQIAKRMSQGLCMPSFPEASPVQPANCNLPPAELRPTLHRKRGLISLWRNASLQPGLLQEGKWDLSLLEALGDAPKPPS
ncbi:hypothetical protein E2320_006196 [Naja naja]|nr:hypothetical protein E2320_006196 [Naja naja]